jgi:hypothetical protein
MRVLIKRVSFKKNTFEIIFILSIMLLVITPVYSEEYRIVSQYNLLTPEEVIKADILAQNNHDLSTYLSLRTTKVGPPENRNEIMILREKYPEYDILQNTLKAQVVGIKPIPLSLVESIIKIDKYLDLYSEIKAYYVAIDYQLKKENRYVYNGVNYRLYLLGLEEGHWVIVEISHIPIYRIIEEGYGFGTEEEKVALEIQKRQKCTGEFINPKGEIIKIEE